MSWLQGMEWWQTGAEHFPVKQCDELTKKLLPLNRLGIHTNAQTHVKRGRDKRTVRTYKDDLGSGPPVPAFFDFGSREKGQPNWRNNWLDWRKATSDLMSNFFWREKVILGLAFLLSRSMSLLYLIHEVWDHSTVYCILGMRASQSFLAASTNEITCKIRRWINHLWKWSPL